jgi:adenosylcobyric acid synthase
VSINGALMVAGTSSDAGKSVLVAGICRHLARQGVKVAPFKAQNMSLNSFVTLDGAEIGRAQAMQAAAAGIEPTADMNPILLKPGSDRRSHIILLGRPDGEADAVGYREHAPRLAKIALDSFTRLTNQYDVVIAEGAGSPAEINLRRTDIANMGLARAASLPVIVVGDIDRGGVFAAMFGTLALLDLQDQRLVSGFVINKFRGAPELLDSGLAMLTQRTGRPVLGVIPWREGLHIDAEDSLALDQPGNNSTFVPNEFLKIAVVRLPRISNFTDADALAAEPGVDVRFVTTPAGVAGADLVILPGSRATVADLAWLRERGLADVIIQRARDNRPVLGICAGYQMLADEIDDEVESRLGNVPGLGLLPVRVRFRDDKTLTRPAPGSAAAGGPGQFGTAAGGPGQFGTAAGGPGQFGTAYEIRHGVVETARAAEAFPGGCRRAAIYGTSWHGVLEDDEFRREFLTEVAAQAGHGFTPAPDTDFAAIREARLDQLGDLVADHLDTGALVSLIQGGPPAMPSVLASLHGDR